MRITKETMREQARQRLKDWYIGHKRERERMLFRGAVARASKPRKKR